MQSRDLLSKMEESVALLTNTSSTLQKVTNKGNLNSTNVNVPISSSQTISNSQCNIIKASAKTLPSPYKSKESVETLASIDTPIVRLLPKKSSVRPITNLRGKSYDKIQSQQIGNTKPSKSDQMKSISNRKINSICLYNKSMYNCMYVLKYMCTKAKKIKTGFGTTGLEDFYYKFRRFRLNTITQGLQHNESNGNNIDADGTSFLPNYYVAAIDIDKCFDNVDTARLYDIIHQLINSSISNDESSFVHRTYDSCEDIHPYGALEERKGMINSMDSTHSKDTRYRIHRYQVAHYVDSTGSGVCRVVRHVAEDGDIIPCSGNQRRLLRNNIIAFSISIVLLNRLVVMRLQKLLEHYQEATTNAYLVMVSLVE